MRPFLQCGLLTAACACFSQEIPDPPAIVIIPVWHTYYFAATAQDSYGFESDYSAEVSFTRCNTNFSRSVKLAWDASTSSNVVNYFIYWGRQSGVYTNCVSAGTNLNVWVQILPPLPTNYTLRISSKKAADLAWSSTIDGPWTRIGATNFTLTGAMSNPAPNRLWRAIGIGSTVQVSRTSQ